jgi:hypothetical protein
MRLATNTFLEKMIVGKYILCKKSLAFHTLYKRAIKNPSKERG